MATMGLSGSTRLLPVLKVGEEFDRTTRRSKRGLSGFVMQPEDTLRFLVRRQNRLADCDEGLCGGVEGLVCYDKALIRGAQLLDGFVVHVEQLAETSIDFGVSHGEATSRSLLYATSQGRDSGSSRELDC